MQQRLSSPGLARAWLVSLTTAASVAEASEPDPRPYPQDSTTLRDVAGRPSKSMAVT
ncbi:hypothetical protein ACFSTC_07350 [Nonomuraea ferruginea]